MSKTTSKSIALKVLEIIIYAGIFTAFIVPIFKPAELEEPNNDDPYVYEPDRFLSTLV
jgi:hypothetical protein